MKINRDRIYCECGNGWEDLISDLFFDINSFIEKYNVKIEILQIKQKYKQLRVYYSYYGNKKYENDFYKIIEKYENKSKVICEICGSQMGLIENNYICKSCKNNGGG